MYIFVILTIIISIYMYHLNSRKEKFANYLSIEELVPKVYISFTTIPSRIAYIDEMLKSVDVPEVYEIHLNLQSEYEYPEEEIKRLKLITPKLKIYRSTEKLLLMSKVVPTLERLLGTNSLVISVDDDMKYSREFVKMLVKNYNPAIPEMIGTSLVDTRNSICDIDFIIPGLFGILYPMKAITRRAVEDLKKAGKLSISCYKADDLAMAVVLKKHGFLVKQISEYIPPIEQLEYYNIDAYRHMTFPPEYPSVHVYHAHECCTALNKIDLNKEN